MQIPSILQTPSLTRLLHGIALGAAATMVIGFYWGGWTLNSTARQMAENRADIAVVAVLAPICVEQFQRQEDAAAKLADFKRIDSWNQPLMSQPMVGERCRRRANPRLWPWLGLVQR